MSVDDHRPKRSPEDAAREEPFLARWARLKREARESAAVEPTPLEERVVPAQGSVAASPEPADLKAGSPSEGAETEAAPAPAPELPSLDSLTDESNFGAFMAPGVTPELRRQALRKMFTNPKYAVVDPLDPYRADYAAFTPLGDIITSDMKYHAERLLRKQLEKDAEAAEAARDAPDEADAVALAAAEPGEAPADTIASPDPAVDAESAAAPDDTPNPTENDDERRNG
jgi:hypothetical protein